MFESNHLLLPICKPSLAWSAIASNRSPSFSCCFGLFSTWQQSDPFKMCIRLHCFWLWWWFSVTYRRSSPYCDLQGWTLDSLDPGLLQPHPPCYCAQPCCWPPCCSSKTGMSLPQESSHLLFILDSPPHKHFPDLHE